MTAREALDRATGRETPLAAMDRRRETSHPASHAEAPEEPDSANANKDLADAA